MSGLSRTPGKRVWANPHRGFESRPLRQMKSTVILENHSAFFLTLSPNRVGDQSSTGGIKASASGTLSLSNPSLPYDHLRRLVPGPR